MIRRFLAWWRDDSIYLRETDSLSHILRREQRKGVDQPCWSWPLRRE